MTTANYPVTSQPYVIFQSGQQQPRYGITNTGAATVYVSSTPQMSTTDGWPLNPGATMPWSAGTYLSVVCATGSTSVVDLIDADVGLFDPSGVAAQINAIGIPPVDQPALIYSRTLTGPTAVASGATPPDTTPIDCTRYQGVYISGTESGITSLTTTRDYTLSWYSDNTGSAASLLARDQFSCATYGAGFQMQRQVRGAFLIITATSAITTTPDAMALNVFGTMRTIPQRTYLSSQKNNTTGLLVAPTMPLAGVVVYSGTINGIGATKIEFPNCLVGCQATLSMRSTATLSDILACDLQTFGGQSYYAMALTPAIDALSANIFLPALPMSMAITNFSTGTPDFQAVLLAQLV